MATGTNTGTESVFISSTSSRPDCYPRKRRLRTRPPTISQVTWLRLRQHIDEIEVSFDDIPPFLQNDRRRDRIWRFIAIIFLTHNGVLDAWQEDNDLLVKLHEAH